MLKNKQNALFVLEDKKIDIKYIKSLGFVKSEENLEVLFELFRRSHSVEFKREIVSSIGRQKNIDRIYTFLSVELFIKNYMDVIYQMYRTCLYKSKEDNRFYNLGKKALIYYKNEVMLKMKEFFEYKKGNKKKLETKFRRYQKPMLLIGDNKETLSKLDKSSVNLIFTSPLTITQESIPSTVLIQNIWNL